jgi:hypothetical protein
MGLLDVDQPPPGPVPEANRPGHRPEVEQDKPTGPPRSAARRHAFRFDAALRVPALLVGVTPQNASVDVGPDELVISFGRWTLRTPIDNIAGAEVTGPYSPLKVVGPPRLSLADRGITFGTSARSGVCIRFESPVPALAPVPWLRHPAATVTVEDPEALVADLAPLP